MHIITLPLIYTLSDFSRGHFKVYQECKQTNEKS